MRTIALFGCTAALLLGASAQAQRVPQPGAANPRLQTVAWAPGETIALTVLPQGPLRLMFELGERVETVEVADPAAFAVQTSADRDSVVIQPLDPQAKSSLRVETDRRGYDFTLRTGNDLLAAYTVQVASAPEERTPVMLARELPPAGEGAYAAPAPPPSERRAYRLKGSAALRPSDIHDDGAKTYLTFAPGQPLPAVFALGPTGGEEVVDGYMRNDVFVIDRVYEQLVLRIDKESLKATRLGTGSKVR